MVETCTGPVILVCKKRDLHPAVGAKVLIYNLVGRLFPQVGSNRLDPPSVVVQLSNVSYYPLFELII